MPTEVIDTKAFEAEANLLSAERSGNVLAEGGGESPGETYTPFQDFLDEIDVLYGRDLSDADSSSEEDEDTLLETTSTEGESASVSPEEEVSRGKRSAPKVVSRPEHVVYGESFYIKQKRGKFFLAHPRWSFTGVGNSLIEAEQSLIDNVKLKAPAFIDRSPSVMTYNAIEMRDFVLKVLD